ncbi:MAG: acyl-CoA dehydratase activase-related protein [Eubacteriales bacterium]|nr:acyl-CoA dehydratase activase-related protein [Eubacteriales bacterium]
MKIGIPKGLLYSKYHVFAKTFFEEIGAEIVESPDTNREILDSGVKYCVDDACLPIKVFHGHVAWLRGKCDYILVPRFMSMEKRKSVCPMFCGLIEMIKNSLPETPRLIDCPVYSLEEKSIRTWAEKAGQCLTTNITALRSAFYIAMNKQKEYRSGFIDNTCVYKTALIGHTYLIHDRFINMNLVNKLHNLGIGVLTHEYAGNAGVKAEAGKLFKQPFWYFARQYYGAAVHLYRRQKVDGIIYVSAFSCGIDSVVVELIKDAIEDFPFMILKIDEHTGEAGFNTRLEAYADMLKRRAPVGCHDSASGQHIFSRQSIV